MADTKADLENTDPTDYSMPETHMVQALNDKYIKEPVLKRFLDNRFGDNWAMFTKLSYHTIIVPEELTKLEIRALVKLSSRSRSTW